MRVPGIERGSTRSLFVGNSLWKGLWYCRRTDCGINGWMDEWMSEWVNDTLALYKFFWGQTLLSSGWQMSGILWCSWMHQLAFHMPSDQIHWSCLIRFSPQVVRSLQTMWLMSDQSNLTKMLSQSFGHMYVTLGMSRVRNTGRRQSILKFEVFVTVHLKHNVK
jgi:hypothetical protein